MCSGGKKVKFVLLNSPIYRNSSHEQEQYLPPLGLVYIASYIEKAGFEVEIVDCVKKRLSVENILSLIRNIKPQYLGINIFTQNFDIVKFIIENIDITCECFIGGPVVKCIYEELLSWKTKNRLNIIIGEGEFIIPAILTNKCTEEPLVEHNLIKVYLVAKESVYYPKSISDIELNRKLIPDSDSTIINHYNEKECAIITSRGCAFDCAFCGGARSLNKDVTIRIRSEKSVINEIEEICKLYPDVQSIRVLDDLFLRNGESVEMASRIFMRFPDLKCRAMVHTLSLINTIDKIKLLHDCNCRELFMGIESGSENIRKMINKLGTVDDVIRVSSAILNAGIDLKGYFIFGFTHETEDDYKNTYDLANKIKSISQISQGNFRTSVFQFRPYHGTKLYNEIINGNGIIHEGRINHEISCFKGRKQFNTDFGNYSQTSDEILNEYIIKTQEL